MPKRIICTVTTDLTYDQRMHRICSSLANAGYNVTLIGRQLKHSNALKKEIYKQKRLRCFLNSGKLFYLEYNLRLLFYLLFKKVDIINSIDLDTLIAGYLVKKIRSKKLVYDAHEYFTEVIELIGRTKTQEIWLKVEGRIIPKLEYCYTVNGSIAELFQKKYQVQFSVIKNTPNLEAKGPQKYDEPPFLIYIGAVNAGRGIEESIRAMQNINCKLIICGDGDIYDDMVKLTKELGLSNKVEFKGYVDPISLRELTARAYAGLLLLENKGKSYYYSLANKFFDYMHAGIPQLVVDFPEYNKVISEFEIGLFSDLNENSIATKANELLNNHILYEKLKQNTVEAKKKYNWQQEEKKLIQFYSKVSSNNG